MLATYTWKIHRLATGREFYHKEITRFFSVYERHYVALTTKAGGHNSGNCGISHLLWLPPLDQKHFSQLHTGPLSSAVVLLVIALIIVWSCHCEERRIQLKIMCPVNAHYHFSLCVCVCMSLCLCVCVFSTTSIYLVTLVGNFCHGKLMALSSRKASCCWVTLLDLLIEAHCWWNIYPSFPG